MGAPEVAKAVADELARAGSTVMFGVPGGGNNLEIVGAAEAAGIRFILAHTETAATIMAATYGDLTGRPTASVVTRGPGATSAVNGVAQALLDRQQLIMITDTVSERDAARISHQRLDQRQLFTAVTKAGGTVGSGDAATTVADAIGLAAASPAGPVHLDFDPTAPSSLGTPARPACVGPSDTAPVDAAPVQLDELLAAAERPVVIVGVAARGIADQVRQLLDGTNIPALCTYRAKGVVPESWPSFAGLMTGATTEAAVLHAADLIVAIGLDTIELIPNAWPYTAPLVCLSEWAEDSPYYVPAVEVVGPLTDSVKRLEGSLRDTWPADFAMTTRAVERDRLLAGPPAVRGLTPQEVVLRTRAAAPASAVATVDAGAHMLVAMPLWDTDLVDGALISSGLATMGFSVPAAIAASLANPGRRIVAFVGDGGLGMCLAELETISRHRLPITVVVFNDSALSLIAIKARPEGHGMPNAITYGDVDFAAIGTAMQVPSRKVDTPDGLTAALEEMWATDGPSLVDVLVDPAGYPHVMDAIRGPRDGR
jgi:acetolactate synthase-1/2/3 large subunit